MPSKPRTGKPRTSQEPVAHAEEGYKSPNAVTDVPHLVPCFECKGLGRLVHQTVTVGEYVAECQTCKGEGHVVGR